MSLQGAAQQRQLGRQELRPLVRLRHTAAAHTPPVQQCSALAILLGKLKVDPQDVASNFLGDLTFHIWILPINQKPKWWPLTLSRIKSA